MEKKKTFYITTPIYYPSGNLHIGHAYTTTLTDVLNRYKKEAGYETFFLTGSDEHGQKIEKKAQEAGLEPKVFLDEKVAAFKDLWKKLHVDYSKFIRTTDDYHVDAVQKIFTHLLEKGYIYEGLYEGLYCITCEEFLGPEQIDDQGLCVVSHDKPQVVKEETYFLKVSQFQDFLTELLNSDFLEPQARRYELLKNFVEPGVKDLSITRISFKWGIPVKENPKHVIYVWLDALTNYITALGYEQADDGLFKKFWADDTEIVQFLGKEITRFHAIYWPVILKMLGLRMPNRLVSHGWILNKDTKMSKSLGNVINPLDFIDEFGADGLRFYLSYELPTDKDGNFTRELFIESYNAHLANNLGNLTSRVNNMITTYFDGDLGDERIDDQTIEPIRQAMIKNYQQNMDAYNISAAIRNVLDFSSEMNKYIEVKEPWNLKKADKTSELKQVLVTLQKAITTINYLMKPILVETYNDMIEQTGVDQPESLNYEKIATFKDIKFKKLAAKKVLFQRIKKD